MGWKSYDYACPKCYSRKEGEVVAEEEKDDVTCDNCCGDLAEPTLMVREHAAPVTFTTIVPTHKTSQALKAGYVHKHVNRPATKTQVGYGGSVSSDHPTGGGKAQD